MDQDATITDAKQAIIDEFSLFDSWTDRYEYIVELGRNLAGLPEAQRIDTYKVPGCQSQVWFVARNEGGRVHFEADSDAMIVRGLIALLLRVYSGRQPEEILATPPEFFDKIELGSHLSGNRANGLYSGLCRRLRRGRNRWRRSPDHRPRRVLLNMARDRARRLKEYVPMFGHEDIWRALDALAERNGLSPSGLARRAGLDATSFNVSKRFNADGKPRWPGTEAMSKVLKATGASLAEFGAMVHRPPPHRLPIRCTMSANPPATTPSPGSPANGLRATRRSWVQ